MVQAVIDSTRELFGSMFQRGNAELKSLKLEKPVEKDVFKVREMNVKEILLLKSNTSSQHSKILYCWGGQEKRKDRKSRKSRSEEKVVGFSSSSDPCKEVGGSHPGWNHGTGG